MEIALVYENGVIHFRYVISDFYER